MELWEFDELVAERAAARMGVQLVPRHVAEHVLGASSRVRASMREAHARFDAEVMSNLKARSLAARHPLLVWRVESTGDFHARLEPPDFAQHQEGARGAPPSVSWPLPIEAKPSLLSILGYQHGPGECDNSLFAIAGRAFQNLAPGPYTPDVLCTAHQAREPTAEELALVDDVAGRLLYQTPEGAAAVTRYGFFHFSDDAEVDRLQLSVSYPVGPDCGASQLFQLPFARVPAKDIGPAIDALFARGLRSPKELAALADAPPAAPSPTPPPGPAVGDGWCQALPGCAERGACYEVARQCLIGSDADCRSSRICREEGWCSLVPGGTKMGDAFLDSLCGAVSDADCASSVACRTGGFCHADNQLCVAKSADDCRAAEACTRFGLCSFAAGACRASSDADCQQASLCRDWHACRAEAGLCR